MSAPYPFSGACPICGDAMTITRLSCGSCGSSLEAAVTLDGAASRPERRAEEGRYGRLARLDATQLEFIEVFLRCRGVIKNVEDMLGISYPTVRSRLAQVLETMGFSPEGELPQPERRRASREILADLAAGRISTEEAHLLLSRAASSEEQEP